MPKPAYKVKFQIKQLFKQCVQHLVLPACYGLWRHTKTDPALVLFADAHHESVPPAMEHLLQVVREDPSLTVREIYRDYAACSSLSSLLHSMRFMKSYARAGTLVICDNFLPAASCRKKADTRVIQLWHASGCYKKFGYDARDDIPEGYKGHVFKNTDLVTVSGKACIKPFCSAMRLPERTVQALGISRTDLYFDPAWKEDCLRRFSKCYPKAAGKKTILWAPTFRGNAGMPSCPDLEPDRLSKELGEDFFLMTRLHPHMRKGLSPEPLSTEELYPAVDLLIADYSSLIYEYLLFGKPLILYVPDLEDYEAHRGFYMDIRSVPGVIVTDRDQLAGAIRKALQEPAEKLQARALFLKEYMGACDGHASERIHAWIKSQRA